MHLTCTSKGLLSLSDSMLLLLTTNDQTYPMPLPRGSSPSLVGGLSHDVILQAAVAMVPRERRRNINNMMTADLISMLILLLGGDGRGPDRSPFILSDACRYAISILQETLQNASPYCVKGGGCVAGGRGG